MQHQHNATELFEHYSMKRTQFIYFSCVQPENISYNSLFSIFMFDTKSLERLFVPSSNWIEEFKTWTSSKIECWNIFLLHVPKHASLLLSVIGSVCVCAMLKFHVFMKIYRICTTHYNQSLLSINWAMIIIVHVVFSEWKWKREREKVEKNLSKRQIDWR